MIKTPAHPCPYIFIDSRIVLNRRLIHLGKTNDGESIKEADPFIPRMSWRPTVATMMHVELTIKTAS